MVEMVKLAVICSCDMRNGFRLHGEVLVLGGTVFFEAFFLAPFALFADVVGC